MEETIVIRICDGCGRNDRDDCIIVRQIAPFGQVLYICTDCERRGLIGCACGSVHARGKCRYD
jgi:acetone carboxylase gamma subunit